MQVLILVFIKSTLITVYDQWRTIFSCTTNFVMSNAYEAAGHKEVR